MKVIGKCRTKRITFASDLSSDSSPCRRVVRGNACSGNTAAHTAPSPAAALRQCLIAIFLHRQRFSDVQCFCAPCRFPCFPVAVGLAQGKPPSDSVSMEHSWGKSPQKLLRCITVEACQVGDYRSYRLMHSAPAPAHTPAQPDHRRQPMRWTPLRTIAKVIPRLISGSGCRSLTCRIQQRKQHPMRWGPFRMISLAECKPLQHG